MSNKLSEFETIALGSNGNNTNNIDRSDRVNSLPRTSQYVTAVPTEKVKHGILNSLCDSQIKLNIANPSSGFKEKMTLAMLGLLMIVLLISVAGCFLMWFTDMYNDSLVSNLILTNGSQAFKWWEVPPVNPLLRVHVFNYTNTERFLQGLDPKLKVEDIGPYVYMEKLEKTDVQFNEDGTISYKEKRTSEFIPELSSGKQYDKVVVPNIPLISAIAGVEDKFISLSALSIAIYSTNSKPFKTLSAQSILWGYEDGLLNTINTFLKVQGRAPIEKFGLLTNRNGTGKDTITIFTGVEDIQKLSIIKSFNKETKLDLWTTESCNSIDGTDGSQFPPHLLDKKSKLNVFIKDMCRKFPLIYEKEVTLYDGIPAWRYKAPDNVFAHPDDNPENQCFCHTESGTCPMSGLFNASACSEGVPIFLSFPHFYLGDTRLLTHFEGLKPDAKLHSTYADIHPRLAFPIDGASRFQISIQLKKKPSFQDFNRFPDDLILPIVWLEVVPGEISPELREMIYHSTFSVNAIQFSLRFGSLFAFIVSFVILSTVCYCRSRTLSKQEEIECDIKKSKNIIENNLGLIKSKRNTETSINIGEKQIEPSMIMYNDNAALTDDEIDKKLNLDENSIDSFEQKIKIDDNVITQ